MGHTLNYIKKHRWLLFLILPAFLIHLIIIFPSGTYECVQQQCGIFFAGVHGTDTVWHLALSSVSFNQWPFQAPTFPGATLGGYNYVMDLAVFLISKLGIPPLITYFKVLPIIWFILITSSSVRFGKSIHESPLFVGLFLLFVYFGGSLAYILSFLHSHTLWGSASLVAMQSIHSLANIQFAFSLVILLEVLLILRKKELNTKDVVLLSIYAFLNVGLKFYGGVITLFSIGVYFLCSFLPLDRKTFLKTVIYGTVIFVSAAISILLFYNPFSAGKTGAIFRFDPFATVHPIIEDSKLVYMPKLVNQRYALNGKMGPRLLYIESVTLLLFLIFNYGVRFLGIIYTSISLIKRKTEKWEVIVLLAIIFSTLLNVLLTQKGEWWNTVQFLYYGIFLANICIAQFLFSLLQKKNVLFYILVAILIIVNLPITLDLLHDYTRQSSLSYLPKEELDGLNYLKKLPAGVVYEPLYSNKIASQYTGLHPLSANYDNAYVAAFSGKQVLYANELQLRLIGVDYKKRLQKIENGDCSLNKDITYAYIVKDYTNDPFFMKCIKDIFKTVYSNDTVTIYKKRS